MKFQSKSGFTLIELLVVISIIGFLATILSVGLSDSRTKSFDTRRANDVFAIQKGINLYFTDNQAYPPGTSLTLGTGASCGGQACSCLTASGFTATCPGGQVIYMAVVPGNPGAGGADYVYTRDPGGNDFTLTFTLDQSTGSIPAGAHTLSASGIDG